MEILFVWINYSERGIFEKKGVNFSPEFDFIFEQQKEKWILYENEKWEKKKTIFKSNVIENVTAIVGKNGTGKTSLLNYLSSLNCSDGKGRNYEDEYVLFKEEKIKKARCLLITREKEKVTIFHNFENGIINNTEYDVEDMTEQGKYQDYLTHCMAYKDIFKIYLTNSGLGGNQKSGITTFGKLDEIALTPGGIATLATKFNDKILDLEDLAYRPNLYYEWRRIIRDWRKKSSVFQQVCDVIYYNKLIESNQFESYTGKISTSISVSCVSILRILDDKFPDFHGKDEKVIDDPKDFYFYYQLFRKIWKDYSGDENFIIKNLIINLLFEVCLIKRSKISFENKSLNDWLEWIDKEANDCEYTNYFHEAISEIKELNEILLQSENYRNLVPEHDLAFRKDRIFDYRNNPKGYKKFIQYITERFEAKNSMILRYLIIGNLGMSSGERAYQNYFSWLNLLPQFYNIDSKIPKEMRSNILLLIDEIDLYLHPEWQKGFVRNMLDEIEKQFSGYKVQIVFATHSPLCLSDIPKENTVYLKYNNGKAEIDERESHRQTFGKDLYSLLNDAFFLDNCTMGLYAKGYIDEIISNIVNDEGEYKKLTLKEVEELYERVNYIGNDILKEKLYDMLKHCMSEKEQKKQLLTQYKKMIEREIKALEN